MNHCVDAIWLLRRHLRQRICAGAHTDRLDAINTETIEQRKHVVSDIAETKHP